MLITINYREMYFFCEDVKVYNYQYYCHCTRNPHPMKTVKKKAKPPKIDIISTNTHAQSTKQSVLLEKQPSTLLERLKRKLEPTLTLISLEEAKSKVNTHACSKPTNSDQSLPFRLEGSSEPYRQSQQLTEEAQPNNFSFCLPKQVLISHTFNQQYSESENCIVEEESQIIQPTLEGKFVSIQRLFINEKYEQKLAIDTQIGFLVSIKTFSLANSESMLHKELQAYNKLGRHQNILELYQVCFDSGRPTFVKQAYSKQNPTTGNKTQIYQDIEKALQYMEKMGVYMKKLELSDIKNCFGVWKVACFQNVCSYREISIKANLSQLLSKIK